MIVWLNLDQNTRWNPNENYARELMELFTLGADRGAYTSTDVRELARALTGWRLRLERRARLHNFRYDPGPPRQPDQDRLRPDRPLRLGARASDVRRATRCTRRSSSTSSGATSSPRRPRRGRQARDLYVERLPGAAVLEAILLHPDLHAGPRMVKPPVVFLAGLLRLLQRGIDGEYWSGTARTPASGSSTRPTSRAGTTSAGSTPPRSAALRAGVYAVDGPLRGDGDDDYTDGDARGGVGRAPRFWGNPNLTAETVAPAHRLRLEPRSRAGRLAAQHLPRACARTRCAT